MGKFVKSISVSVQFDGDTIVFTCEPMKKAAAIKMQSFPKKPLLDDKQVPVLDKDTGGQLMTVGEEGGEFMMNEFEKHVTDVSGARDAAGNAIDKETVFTAAYFLPAISDAAVDWCARSFSGN